MINDHDQAQYDKKYRDDEGSCIIRIERILKAWLKSKLVIQGSHMVSGTRCPAWSDQVKKWSESRAVAPKGRCPVGHRGKFPYVPRGNKSGLI